MRIIDHHDDLVRHGRAYVNGVRLHYLTAGEGDPVLLLHGVPKTSYHWRHVIPLLTPHYRVVVPDMRGLGDSQHTPDGSRMSGSLATSSMRNPSGTLKSLTLSAGERGWGASSGFGIWPQIVPVIPSNRSGTHKCLVWFIASLPSSQCSSPFPARNTTPRPALPDETTTRCRRRSAWV